MKSAATIVLIRCMSEIDHARCVSGDVLYLCATRDILDHCQSMGFKARFLSEDLLDGCQPEINDWGYRCSIELVSRLKVENDPKFNFFIEANFYFIKGILVQTAKFILALESFLKTQSTGRFYLSRSSDSLLSYVCRTYLEHQRPEIQVIDYPQEDLTRPANNPVRWMERVRKAMAVVSNAQAFLMLRSRARKKRRILFVSGSLNHLRAVVLTLKSKHGCYPVFIENEFCFSKYWVFGYC